MANLSELGGGYYPDWLEEPPGGFSPGATNPFARALAGQGVSYVDESGVHTIQPVVLPPDALKPVTVTQGGGTDESGNIIPGTPTAVIPQPRLVPDPIWVTPPVTPIMQTIFGNFETGGINAKLDKILALLQYATAFGAVSYARGY